MRHSGGRRREGEGAGEGRETGSVAGSPDRTRRGVERVVAWYVAHMDHGISHKTGHGYVKAHRGFYHDAIFVKRNNFNAAPRDVRRRLLAHRRSQAAPPRAQSRARQR